MPIDDPRDPRLESAIAALRDSPPPLDLWPGIARTLHPRRPRGTLLVRWPVALAAGLAIATLTSATTVIWLHHQAAPASPGAIASLPTPTPTPLVSASFAPADAALAQAISQLESVVRMQLATVAPGPRTAVDSSLAALDRAVAQAAARQAAAPNDPDAADYLTSTLRKKLQVLRTVSHLTAES
jgi:hypothetical protein